MKIKVFVDASFWIALVDTSDSSHKKAEAFLKRKGSLRLNFFTSDYVIDECLTRLKKKVGAKSAFSLYDVILKKKDEKTLTILQTTKEVFDRIYKIFKNNLTPKSFSFTDASIVALMKAHKIKNLLTFDSDFRKIKPKIQVLP